MWRVAVAVVGMVALVSCGSAAADRDAGNSEPITTSPGTPVQAVAAALAFAAHSDPEVAVVNGYVTLPSAVQRGEQPINLAAGDANPVRPAARAALHTTRASRDPGWLPWPKGFLRS
jgi:hypothetical protein